MARPRPSLKPRRPQPAPTLDAKQPSLSPVAARVALRAKQRMWFDVLRTSERFYPAIRIQNEDSEGTIQRNRPSAIPMAEFMDELESIYEQSVAETMKRAEAIARQSPTNGPPPVTPEVKRQLSLVRLARHELQVLGGDLLDLEGRLLRLRKKPPRRRPNASGAIHRRRRTNNYEPLEVLQLVARVFAAFAPLIADPERDLVGYALTTRAHRSLSARGSRPKGDIEQRREWMIDRRAMEPRESVWRRAVWVVENHTNLKRWNPEFRRMVRRLSKLRH